MLLSFYCSIFWWHRLTASVRTALSLPVSPQTPPVCHGDSVSQETASRSSLHHHITSSFLFWWSLKPSLYFILLVFKVFNYWLKFFSRSLRSFIIIHSLGLQDPQLNWGVFFSRSLVHQVFKVELTRSSRFNSPGLQGSSHRVFKVHLTGSSRSSSWVLVCGVMSVVGTGTCWSGGV